MDDSSDIGTKNYRFLLAVVADHLSLDEASFLDEQRLVLGEVCLRFEYLAHTRLCRVGLELSPMPGDAESLKALLESNAFPEEGLLPVMAVDPESGKPMVFVHFPAEEEAELSMRCFLDFGMNIFLAQWEEMWRDSELEKPAATVGLMA